MSYKKNRHSCYDLSYHLVVVTKYRHPVIVGEIKDRLIELSYRMLEKNFPCEVLEINTDVDHIHIMFDAPPQVQLSALVNSYKTVTARLLRKVLPPSVIVGKQTALCVGGSRGYLAQAE